MIGKNGIARLDQPSLKMAATSAMLGANKASAHARYPHASSRGECYPALLVSYYYLRQFLKNQAQYVYRDWVMDSGAFSAKNSGVEIILSDYIRVCQELLQKDPSLTAVFALDVIGDWRQSEKNCQAMWRAGVEAIPCWHSGEPWDVLKGLSRDYPRIAIGGLVGLPRLKKRKIVEQVFARVWPKSIHGFGLCTEDLVLSFPFTSVDATNWEMGPCAFGRWSTFGKMSVRGSKQNLRAEVEWHLALEQKARRRWKREMALLAEHSSPSIRLAQISTGRERGKGLLQK